MKKILQTGKKVFDTATAKALSEFESGMKVVMEVVNGLPVFVSLERVESPKQEFEEKHYFVIPYYLDGKGNIPCLQGYCSGCQ